MARPLLFLVLASAISAASFPRTEPTPDHYTVCGGDRGYTEVDSLEAIDYLSHSIVSSDHYFMAKKDCIYAHVNTTIVSLCNGNYRDRHVTQSEVNWGFTQLIKDCGLEGAFPVRLDGEAGGRSPSGVKVTLGAGHEIGISNGFSINADGVIKEVIGLGVTYEWSLTEAKSVSIDRTAEEMAPPGSCGTLSKKKLIKGQPCVGTGCNQKPDPDTCEGDVETVENVCSMTAKRHPDGSADVDWVFRFEWEDGAPCP
ncbi:hypothetical protein PG995_007604 [Apiospora arundinis]